MHRDLIHGTNIMSRFCHLDFALYKIQGVHFIAEPCHTDLSAMVQPLYVTSLSVLLRSHCIQTKHPVVGRVRSC